MLLFVKKWCELDVTKRSGAFCSTVVPCSALRKSHHLRLNNQNTQTPARTRYALIYFRVFCCDSFPSFCRTSAFSSLALRVRKTKREKEREDRASRAGWVEPAKKRQCGPRWLSESFFKMSASASRGVTPTGGGEGGQEGGRGVVNPRGVGWQDGAAR